MSATVLPRTARREHRCTRCRRRIPTGHRYLRHTVFPDDAAANSTGRPFAEKECVACSAEREGDDPLLVAGAHGSFCHGTNPCALPARHAGDCSCQDCPERVR